MGYTFFHDLEPCPCGKCDGSILVADDGPRVEGDDENVLTLSLLSASTLDTAFHLGGEAKSKRQRGEDLTEEEEVIIGLLDALLLHREVLLRIVIHGVEGTGDAEHDGEEFDRAIELAQDVACAGFNVPVASDPRTPVGVCIDATLVYDEMDAYIAESLDDDGDGDLDDHEVCVDPDCELHRDKPTPTDFEA